MKFIRPWGLPFVPFYYLGSLIVKKFYDWEILKSEAYNFPVITVGNLSAGGTGKSPFVGYLVNLLKDKKNIAVLSRGYGRSSKGFQLIEEDNLADFAGDEPLQLKQTHPKIIVAVDADRRNGINQLKKQNPDVIILDDAFQHRKVKAGLQILLTAHYNLYSEDCMLPAGDLREPISAAARADIIIVTKCPEDLSKPLQKTIIKKLNPLPHQKVFFTSIAYAGEVFSADSKQKLDDFLKEKYCLVTGIAEPKPLVDFLKNKDAKFQHLNFPDHHNFTENEIQKIAQNGKILTTQKDFMRLQHVEDLKDKLFYLPITIKFLGQEKKFNNLIEYFIK